MLTEAQKDRYSRHLALAAIGESGQERLLGSSCLIVGLGGLGSPAALYLAGAGVGRLILADYDTVERSNLHRQPIYTTERIGELKTQAARDACLAINPDIAIETCDFALGEPELDELLGGVDLVLDATDNTESRLEINAACVRHQTPLISGAAIRTEGQIAVFLNRDDGPCYRCLLGPDQAPEVSCASVGVLGPVVGTIGTLQALEAIKILSGIESKLCDHMLIFDGLETQWQQIKLKRDKNCPICSNRP